MGNEQTIIFIDAFFARLFQGCLDQFSSFYTSPYISTTFHRTEMLLLITIKYFLFELKPTNIDT